MSSENKQAGSGILQDVSAVPAAAEETDLLQPRQVPPDRYDQRVLKALRQITRAFDLHSRHLLGQHNITGPQLVTLLTVEKHQPVTVSGIAGHVYLSPSTVIGILDRLEAKGLIRRDRNPKDRRMVQISLTEQGEVLAMHAPSPLQERLAEAMDTLPESELETIAESLERIVDLMKKHQVDDAPFY